MKTRCNTNILERFKSPTHAVRAVTALCLAAGLSSASAQFVVDPTGATAFDSRGDALPASAVDGSGLSNSTIVENGDSIPDPWPSHSTALGDTWTAAHADAWGDNNVWIQFELSEEVDLSSMHVWNQNETTDRGVNEVVVSFSTDGVNFGGEQTFNIAQAPGATSYEGDDYALDSTTSATHVNFDIRSNHGSGSWVGLSEVRFEAVPEPATTVLFLGLAVAGATLIIRRRRA